MSDAEAVKLLLSKLGMEQQELAEELDVSPGAVSNIVHGRRVLSRWMIQVLIRRYCLPDDFFADNDEEARGI